MKNCPKNNILLHSGKKKKKKFFLSPNTMMLPETNNYLRVALVLELPFLVIPKPIQSTKPRKATLLETLLLLL